jgi:hypothetical protein
VKHVTCRNENKNINHGPGLPGSSRETFMSDSIKLISAVLDCPDAGDLAAFYAEITRGSVTFLDNRWATVKGPGWGRSRVWAVAA